jgi:hypothetical protein
MTKQPDQTVAKWQGVAREKFKDVRISDIHESDFHLHLLDQLIADVVEDVRRDMAENVRLLIVKHYKTEDFDEVGFLEDLRRLADNK